MMKAVPISRMLLVVLLASLLPASEPAYARNLYVYDRPPREAVFIGNFGGNVEKYINKNFVYPPDAWRSQKWNEAEVSVLVRVDGKVEEFYIENNKEKPHPLLVAEMERVIDGMVWCPGYVVDTPVNSYHTFRFPLAIQYPKYNYHIPTGMKDRFEKAWHYACRWSMDDNRSVPDEQEEQEALRAMEKNGILFSDSPQILSGLVRVLCSENRTGQALLFIDNGFEEYQKKYRTYTDTITGINIKMDPADDYSGRSEAWLAALRAVMHDYAASGPVDSLYDAAIGLIDDRIIDEFIYPCFYYSYPFDYGCNMKGVSRDLANMKNYLRFHPTDDATLKEVRELEKSILQGEYAKNSDQLNLFGAKAMMIWLRGGDEAFRSYLAQLRSGKLTGKLKKYLDRLEKKYNANSGLLSDHRGVVTAMACFVPSDFPTDPDRHTFYARRRAIAEVFPICWLSAVS